MWLRLVGGREDFGLVDVVDLERLEHARLGEVADARLGHDGDRHGLLDPADHRRVAHARHAAVTADVGRHALERHHRGGARRLGDLRLLGVDDVHDDAALEHLGEAGLDPESRFVAHPAHCTGGAGPSRRGSCAAECRAVATFAATVLLQAEGLDAVRVALGVAAVDAVGERLDDAQQRGVRAHVGRRVRRVVELQVRELGDVGQRRVGDRDRLGLAVAGDLHRAHDERVRAAGAEGRSRACRRRSGRSG